MSNNDVLRGIKDALKAVGETFRVERATGAENHMVKGKRYQKDGVSKIWFAGDADIQEDDTLTSMVTNSQLVVLSVDPMIHDDELVRLDISVEALAKYRERKATTEQAQASQARRNAEAEFDAVRHIVLDERQKGILFAMVEAMHSVPDGSTIPFDFMSHDLGSFLMHKGLPSGNLDVLPLHLDILEDAGLVRGSGARGGDYVVTPLGSLYYRYCMVRTGSPVERIESNVHRYLNADDFRQRYPAAYDKWAKAESELWSADLEAGTTMVGHLCREAMQEFADTLINKYNPPDPEKRAAQKTQVKNRVWAAVLHASSLGTTQRPFLEALLTYWDKLVDLVQRQEHGGLKEGEPVDWQDSRRVVFHTAVVMFEIDNVLRS
ncbi:MAG TPA: hypothetical protein VJ183_02055 [Chloroflexia bacterium]|nr:hypothetical protein [Chloroflexia bacterium]